MGLKSMGFKTEISKLHYNKEPKGFLKNPFFALLKFCSYFYAIGSGLKNKLYDQNILNPQKVDAYVVSVGNLTTGGVGKTPVVAQIAQHYIAKGEKVAIVSRGYGSKLSNKNINVISEGKKIFFNASLAGDEPFWLAEHVKGAQVITSKNRYKASKYAIEKFGATKIILDDGFQHRKLHRDLDIVLVDSEMGFGNDNLLPAGPLREGPESFKRIDKLVVVSKNLDHTRAEKYARIMGKKLHKETIVCYTEPIYAFNIHQPGEKLQENTKVIAFSAIGQPQQFYKFLEFYEVIKKIDFDDHHQYSQTDIDKLAKICAKENVTDLITTEKDCGKLLNLKFKNLKIFALKLQTKLDVEKLLNEKSDAKESYQ